MVKVLLFFAVLSMLIGFFSIAVFEKYSGQKVSKWDWILGVIVGPGTAIAVLVALSQIFNQEDDDSDDDNWRRYHDPFPKPMPQSSDSSKDESLSKCGDV